MVNQSVDFSNLSGGLNTAFSNELLASNEFLELKNMEIDSRGTLKRRKGLFKYYDPSVQGFGQGFFRLFRKGRLPIEIFAINGKLYQRPLDSISLNELLDYEYDSVGTGYRVIRLPLTNFKTNTTITLNTDNTLTLANVASITAANQISLSAGFLKLSLPDNLTGWSATPNLTQMRNFFLTNKFGFTYEVPSTELVVTGLPLGFQKIRSIEAVQYKDKMYLATGTKMIVFDGATASVLDPYKPTTLEALYIGTNALADDPSNFMADGVANELRIDGVTSSLRIGVINTKTTLTVYVSKPDTIPSVEYKISYRKVGDANWTLGRDFTTTKTYDFIPTSTGDYEFDVYARKAGDTVATPARFIVPSYTVKSKDENEVLDFSAIHRCNRVLLHWERIIVYGDDYNSSMIYISDLKKPSFFPIPNSLSFENKEMGQITSLVRYRDMLVAFTPSSIQALYGKSPDEYQRVTLNTSIGCISPFSTRVVNNYIVFLSKDGVYLLESVGYTEEKANVTKIDQKVNNIVKRVTNAVGSIHNGQYKVFFPSEKKLLRTYYDQNWSWAKDESEKMDISYANEWDDLLYVQSMSTGTVYYFKDGLYSDDGYVYEDLVVTKEYDFETPYSDKKIKEMKFLLSTSDKTVNLSLSLVGDGNLLVNPNNNRAEVVNGSVVWVEELMANLSIHSGTVMGAWVLGLDGFGRRETVHHKQRISGRFKRLRLMLSHKEATSNNIISFGFIYTVGKSR